MSEAEKSPVQEELLSERYLDPKNWTWRGLAINGAGLAGLTLFVLAARSARTALAVLAAVAGFAVFFVLVSDTWDLATRRANFHWAYGAWVLIAAAVLAILIAWGTTLAVLLVPSFALLIFGTLKVFGDGRI